MGSITNTFAQMPFVMIATDKALDVTIKCSHCGDDCGKEPIAAQDLHFCCTGCQMVYDIIHEHNLDQFYSINSQAGISKKSQKSHSYRWLNDPNILAALIDFQDDKQVILRLNLPQIHCSACIYLLENLHKFDDGIRSAKVNFLKKEIKINYSKSKTNLETIANALSKIGYPPAIKLADLEASPTLKSDRTLIYQLGLAGFVFGNIMLLSFPEYLGLQEAGFQHLFGYLNILLAIPVLVYSAKPYLQSAWSALLQRHLNIDVPISIGILSLFGRSCYEILSQTNAGYLDSMAGLVFFLLIGKWFQQKTYHHLSFDRDYKSYFPITANALIDGQFHSKPVNQLQVNDIIQIKNHELIPSDGILLSEKAHIDYSFVTGESDPQTVKEGNIIYAGGRQIGNNIEVKLTKEVSQSYLTTLWNDAAFTKNDEKRTTEISLTIGKYFTWAILTIATATLAYWFPKDMTVAVNAFTAVLIIACPCAIALSIPFTFGNAIRLLGRYGIYLKNATIIERLSKIDSIIFDKTGTLTEANAAEIGYIGRTLTNDEKIAIKSLCAQSNHPVSQQIAAHFATVNARTVHDFEEVIGFGIKGFVGKHWVEVIKSTGAIKGTSIRINGDNKGVFQFKNSYRSSWNTIANALKTNFKLYLLSGDNDHEKDRLKRWFHPQNLHFNQSPKDKLHFIKSLQKNHATTMMIGDGLNDAGALKQSNIGMVLSENTNNFTPASDIIMDAKTFVSLPELFQYSKTCIRIVYASYVLALVYNIIGLSFAVQGLLTPVIAAILMPLSSITIVVFGVAMSYWLNPFKRDTIKPQK